MIETRHLYYFLAVVREESIVKAAQALHISQPALSKQMIDLERHLGKQLFIRSNKKITLTEDGVFLSICAQEMMDLMEKTESAFRSDDNHIEGDVYLGCAETPLMYFISGIFKKVQADYPGIRFHVHSGNANSIVERLDKGLLDIGLLMEPTEFEKYDYLILNHKEMMGLLMPQDCELAQKQAVTIHDIQDIPLIFPGQIPTENSGLNWLGFRFPSLHIVATYNLIYNATFMVQQGMGYALAIKDLVQPNNAQGLTFRPLAPPIEIESYIVTKKYQTFSAAARVFLDRLKAEISSEASRQ